MEKRYSFIRHECKDSTWNENNEEEKTKQQEIWNKEEQIYQSLSCTPCSNT